MKVDLNRFDAIELKFHIMYMLEPNLVVSILTQTFKIDIEIVLVEVYKCSFCLSKND